MENEPKPRRAKRRAVNALGVALALLLGAHALGLVPKEVLDVAVPVLAPSVFN